MKFHILTTIALLLLASLASAHEHDLVFEAKREGKIKPLADILPEVQTRFDARLLEVELESSSGNYYYELEMLTRAGTIVEVLIDATSGKILRHDEDHDD